MTTVYFGKDSRGFRIRPGHLQIIGYECYIHGICSKIGKSHSSVSGAFSRGFIRVKAKHHIKRLQEIFPEIEITEDKLEQGMAIELPTNWSGPTSSYGWKPGDGRFWNDLMGSLRDDWRITLGLGTGTITYEEARKAFRKKVKETHPDRGGDSEEFVKVMKAWRFAKVYFGK